MGIQRAGDWPVQEVGGRAQQRRDDQLASHREQMTLQLGILSEQKAAKIIQLLEELRRDHPSIHNRLDSEAHAMSTPANPQTVLKALKESPKETLSNERPPST